MLCLFSENIHEKSLSPRFPKEKRSSDKTTAEEDTLLPRSYF